MVSINEAKRIVELSERLERLQKAREWVESIDVEERGLSFLNIIGSNFSGSVNSALEMNGREISKIMMGGLLVEFSRQIANVQHELEERTNG